MTGFVGSHALTWELTMAALTLGYVALSLLVDEGFSGLATAALDGLAGVFLIEFAVRFWGAESRVEYLRAHWIDLVTCLPPIGALRALRLLRLLGLLRLAQEIRDVGQTRARNPDRANTSVTWIVWPTALLLWLGAADGFWIVERGHNSAIKSFGDALYLAFITVTTVGYGDIRPVTPEGKVIAGGLVFVGLGLLGFISAQLTARWLRTEQGEGRVERQLATLSQDVAEIKELLRSSIAREEKSTL
ncbi:MAG TPA: ion channel [Candidatus Dormibacteraeota bacterium]|nr:ion channel [Candidatus Dormibacteraeota bacterium]